MEASIEKFYEQYAMFNDNFKLTKQVCANRSMEYICLESIITKCEGFAKTKFSNKSVQEVFSELKKIRKINMKNLTKDEIVELRVKMRQLEITRQKYKKSFGEYKSIDYIIARLNSKINGQIEYKDVPQFVIVIVLSELEKSKIDPKNITHGVIEDILKKNELIMYCDYSEDIVEILKTKN